MTFQVLVRPAGARVRKIEAWRPAQAEVVQPRRLPDGLLEVRLEDETEADLFLVEVATYPERRVGEQMTDDRFIRLKRAPAGWRDATSI